MVAAAVSTNCLSNYHQKPKRTPLLPSSEADNNNNNNNNNEASRRTKYKEITSRYLSTSSSSSVSTTSSSSSSNNSVAALRRCQSPMLNRTVRPLATPAHGSGSVKRSLSVDRRRPGPVETPSATRLLTNSGRSLSVSFQGESLSIPVCKPKPAPVTNIFTSVRKGIVTPERRKVVVTPERRRVNAEEFITPVRDRSETVKLSDQHRWPGRSKSQNSSFLTRSLDCGSIDKPKYGSRSVIDEYNRVRTEAKVKPRSDHVEVDVKTGYGSVVCGADALGSDSESVSSGSTSGVGNGQTVARVPRGIVVPARFWQETNNRIQRGPEQNGKLRIVVPSKQMSSNNRKFVNDSPTKSPQSVVPASRGLASPLRGGLRPASPNKALMTTTANPLRTLPSPTRTRNGIVGPISNNACLLPSILSFAPDARRRKVGEDQIVDAHELRLLYNRHLQWRFVNARAEAALKAQTATAERNLYNAWLTILKLRRSVKSKRIQLQLLRQNVKLYSILKGQGQSLEIWSMIDGEYCNSLSEATCALEASTIRLPVVAGARAEVQDVKDAISSAVDVMQAMWASVCSLLSKVEQVDVTVNELANVAANERALLDQCNDLFSSLTAVQVKDCSLRTHLLQIKRGVSCSTTEV